MTSSDDCAASRTAPVAGRAELLALLGEIEKEQRINEAAVNLVPSENRISPWAGAPLRTDFYNRYFFNDSLDPQGWQFRGGEGIGRLEKELALPALRRLGRADHVNIRPVSGMSAMLVVLLGLGGEPGDGVVCVDAETGGHYATGRQIAMLGRRPLPVRVVAGRVDLDALRTALTSCHVPLVYLDLQNSLWELDVAGVAEVIARTSPRTVLHVDCSHTLGLILGGSHKNPLDLGADTTGGSTHKTFPGPQKGVLFTRDENLSRKIRDAQFFTISSHHFAETLALALAAAEFEHFGAAYSRQVLINARAFAHRLRERGFGVVEGGPQLTDTHQVWVRLPLEESADAFSAQLASLGIRVNVQTELPDIPEPALRLGVSEITLNGGREPAMETLAEIFALVRAGEATKAVDLFQVLPHEMGEPYFFTGLPQEAGLFHG
uniref:Putative serine hydroxymethyltransferase n=1 Tax=Streptomyces sp. NRRL 30471 TaxID=996287 RepID=F2WUC9_9ACTN|nr:putative serine hydroxymethyltransferase [Streptomyces sp. NRRL 30471]